ncbi:LuxR family transcriptional regulator [Pseudomonas sp. S1Bt30]|uniref:LuxR family transcriptional regulator n=1 Tax=Pseudomonas quebecensis TaxID=2995174 RepID=A0ABY6QI47_9PSED|nr:LuxR family transcriptional regulator [Pseudomonas quebecensis]MCX4065130.1 LuxR family transcriptional regulator [Pseudomonas quebecensis]UZW19037.1 LuxR family transcriptional regulator [Pseudomonas quebecensis]UZW23548.1 LuxR family transcriptional regulator [Pseudomonas quebecensis]UZW28610.1 LuxR family transcriptional regulator [Pseudomonas quebecensis]
MTFLLLVIMVDMKLSEIEIQIVSSCSPILESAIRELVASWKPYSSSARRFPILRLIEGLIDPAIQQLTIHDSVFGRYVVGAGGKVSLSALIRTIHFKAVMRAQQVLIRQYISATKHTGEQSREVLGTLETIVELVGACGRKRPVRSRCPVKGVTQNEQRNRDLCEVCGNPSELTRLIDTGEWPEENDPDYALHLSSRYCVDHRPRYADGSWNSQYLRAKRSKEVFSLELVRLTRQSAQRSPPDDSEGSIADRYAFYHAHSLGLTAADEVELRGQARLMTDARLTDTKKQMLMLRASGLNQSEIARTIGISRQAVSKALASIPSSFQLGGAPEHPVR